LITGEPPKQAEDRKKPNPSACTGLAEHLLPRRHGLIQSFPRRVAEATTQTFNTCSQSRGSFSRTIIRFERNARFLSTRKVPVGMRGSQKSTTNTVVLNHSIPVSGL